MIKDLQHSSLLGMMVSLQRKLDQQSTAGQERLFFSHGLTYLSTCSGRQIKVEDWMITTFEVDFMEEIGSGGLYVVSYLACLTCALQP